MLFLKVISGLIKKGKLKMIKVFKLVSGEQIVAKELEFDEVQCIYKLEGVLALSNMVDPRNGQPITQLSSWIITDEQKHNLDSIHIMGSGKAIKSIEEMYTKAMQKYRMSKIGIVDPMKTWKP